MFVKKVVILNVTLDADCSGGVVYTGAYVKFLPPLPTEFVVQLKLSF